MQVPDLGKAVDQQRRLDTRKPRHELFQAIRKARKRIFKGFNVSGSSIEKAMGPGSRLPIMVRLTAQHPQP